MLTRRWLQTVWRRLLVLAFGLGLAVGAAPAAGAPQAPGDVSSLYVPYLARLMPLAGRVTLHGGPVAGVQLELRYDDGARWNSLGTTLTNANGEYAFQAPTLNPRERYQVQYTNTSDPSRLGYWYTRQLTSFDAGVGHTLATFDIANVPIQSPAHNAVLTLPVEFRWGVRPASPGDSYQLFLFDPASKFVILSDRLGYVGSTTLFGPLYITPAWFQWWVVVYPVAWEYGPLDAFGTSFYPQWVYLSEPALTALRPAAQGESAAARLRLEWFDPATDRPRLPPAWPGP